MVNIAACWITKGDEELSSLQRSIKTVAPYVSSIHVTANSDKTTQTERWCKEMGYNYSFLPWNKNFSAQRNFNFEMAVTSNELNLDSRQDVDYCFWMDSDDVLIGGDKLQEVAEFYKKNDVDCVFFDYWYSMVFDGEPAYENIKKIEVRHMRERLIKPGRLVWKKRIHETPVQVEGINFKQTSYDKDDIVVVHLGATRFANDKKQEERTLRNTELLELELEDERKNGNPDPRTIVYLMKQYAETHDEQILEKNILLGKEYLTLSGWDQERGVCLVLMGRSAQELGRLNEALDYFHEAIKEFPFSNNFYVRLATCLCDLGNYKQAQHYLELALAQDERYTTNGVEPLAEDEMLATEVSIRLVTEWEGHHNYRKAYKLAQRLTELLPVEQNQQFEEKMRLLANLDVACEHTEKLCQYLEKEGHEKAVLDVLKSVPTAISQQPFAIKMYKRVSKPKFWQRNEIAYYCGQGLEHWDAESLKKGIGGSETAVIELTKEWTKMGWKVTVYGDPGVIKVIDGVTYVPWYYFNPKDKFNIFIEWRNTYFADKISAKKYFVDFHDVITPQSVKGKLQYIDGIMVKSEAHKNLLMGEGYEKVHVISNGIS